MLLVISYSNIILSTLGYTQGLCYQLWLVIVVTDFVIVPGSFRRFGDLFKHHAGISRGYTSSNQYIGIDRSLHTAFTCL